MMDVAARVAKRRFWWGLGAGTWAALYFLRREQRRRSLPPVETGPEQARYALVTGASSGIGAAYALRLANEGYNLVLVARRVERLQALATEIEQHCGVKVRVLVADLATPQGQAEVERAITEAESLDVLVNNAGFGSQGDFAGSELPEQVAMHSLHVLAPMRFTRAALPQMLARGRGSIVNVASLMAFYPLPGQVSYSATKTYLKTFTEALALELRGTGVRVQVLCPGFTRTEFQIRADIGSSHIPDFVWMSATRVVEQSFRDLQYGEVVSVPGWGYRWLAELARFVPRPLLYYVGVVMRDWRD